MAMCTSCSEMSTRLLDAAGHEQLQRAGACCYRVINRVVTVEQFRCRTCASHWEYTNDVKDFRAGWRRI